MGILRKHSAPNFERLERYRTHIPELEKLAFSSAEYCLAEETETKHYGLDSDTYAHTSSPIRRYADLVNQRALKLLIRNLSERYIVPLAMYDMNYRAKLNKNFGRDMDFLNAIATGQTTFIGIVIDKTIVEDQQVKIKIYVPLWKRTISAKYKYVKENMVLSRDEKREIDVTRKLLSSLAQIVDDSKIDFRKLNSDYIISSISEKITKLMKVPEGTRLKALNDYNDNYGQKSLTKDQYYEVRSTSTSNGYVTVLVNGDKNRSSWFQYSCFEDVQSHRDDLLNSLFDS